MSFDNESSATNKDGAIDIDLLMRDTSCRFMSFYEPPQPFSLDIDKRSLGTGGFSEEL